MGETRSETRPVNIPVGCPITVGKIYNPTDPHDDYLKNLKNGDIVHKKEIYLFAPDDVANYFSGNRRGHELCYPVNCPPLTIEFEGVNGINEITSWNEHGGGDVLWRK